MSKSTMRSAAAGFAISISVATAALAQTPAFVAPPRSTADIEAILKNEKPDAERVAKLQARASAQIPQNTDKKALARFYFDRGEARGELGRVKEGIADVEQAIALAREENMSPLLLRYQLILGALNGW